MSRCPECRRHFRVPEDEDDGQHGCPYCGYGERDDEPFAPITRTLTDGEQEEEPDGK